MRTLLAILLIASLALNVYLWPSESESDSPPQRATTTQTKQVPPAMSAATSAPRHVSPAPAEPHISTLHQWLEQGRYSELEQVLHRALKRSPNDTPLLLLEAELTLRTQPLAEAILHFYDLLDLPLPPQQHRDIQARITSLVYKAANQLKQSGSWSLLAQFSEPLFQRRPANRQYALWLAEAYARQDKPTLTEDVLASLPPDDPQVQRIRGLLTPPAGNRAVASESPQPKAGASVTVALERGVDQYFIPVRFGNQSARLLLDTGASTSAITPSLFRRLRRDYALPFIGNFTVNTAAGEIRAPMHEMPDIQIGPLAFPRTAALVLPESVLSSADGLLGMNILRGYHFGIDQRRGQLTLSPVEPQSNR